jgi:hypothetical protein
MNQKEATYNAICAVTGHKGDGAVEISKEQRAQVNMILFEGFRAGKIELDREFTDQELKQYVSGLQSNWIRKDKRLNGGVQYTAKSPGSRANSGDPSLKAMRTLLTTLTTDEDKAEVQAHINARVAELNVAKAPSIDYSALPTDLQAKFKK